MTTNRLEWRALVPDTESYQEIFAQPYDSETAPFAAVQPRLTYGLVQLSQSVASADLMLVKAAEEAEYLNLIANAARECWSPDNTLTGGHYLIEGARVTLRPAESAEDNFAGQSEVVVADWIEAEQLFGCVRQFAGEITLTPGLVHQANGGILVLSLRSVLAQPLLWLRLKQMVIQGRFDWISPDETRPLPVSIPSLPLNLKMVLVGERESLADFQDMEPELATSAIYSEFEENLQIASADDMALWCQWIYAVAKSKALPAPATDAWTAFIREAVRYTGDQETLPLCPSWIGRQLREVASFTEDETFGAAELTQMLAQREWREGYLAERMQDEILLEQILIETDGEMVGQINALSVIEFPGHPRAFGEPSRISCVVHVGDGEFIDVERKAELGGNIHAKGMMIMQAFLMSELQLEQQIPFSASLTFEQSYSEVDGDSASMAELCALISALANVPIYQHIAVTGSVDQFGRVQPVGGLNEKIEGFFRICQEREFTGKQGVIIPVSNVRHLCLHQDVLDAVEQGQFTIWAIDDVTDALPLLTNVPWDGEGQNTLMRTVQERIAQASAQDIRHRYPWPLRWLNWFNQN
ncbi:MAG TPA: Lon protease family protein [Buttiauxella sp.]|uniref:Lon protease family protein n=1 Tax=Buttiauxella sp. TaxID=1972222 RepID=UPI002B46D89E|nr:Lon protease family protein [Buttiauxella sp.]HKM97261.1 Lon protease family protein [Buttiauxella sp.]